MIKRHTLDIVPEHELSSSDDAGTSECKLPVEPSTAVGGEERTAYWGGTAEDVNTAPKARAALTVSGFTNIYSLIASIMQELFARPRLGRNAPT